MNFFQLITNLAFYKAKEMSFKTRLRLGLIGLTGYFIYKRKDIYVSLDLHLDLKERIGLQPKVIFDVGANIGQTAKNFRAGFPKSKIYCFEPVSDTFRNLEKNLKNDKNIELVNLALGDKEEFVFSKIFDDKSSVLNSLNVVAMNKNEDARVEKINVMQGDSFCKRNRIPEIDLLKIDTEGYEIKVINGFTEMIKNNRIHAIFCEVGFNPENNRNSYFGDINSFLYDLGFSLYGIYEVRNSQIKTGNNYGNALYLSNAIVKKLPF